MKEMKKSTLPALLSFVMILLLLTGCGNKDPLIATWEEPNSGITMQFKDDGNVVMSNYTSSITLPYVTEDPDKITIKASEDGVSPDQVMNYRVEEDKLILTVDGVETVFDRVK